VSGAEWQALNAEIVACRMCARLVEWRELVARQKRRAYLGWDYWARPVPGFGDPRARLLLVGLAPGAHGSNRTGRAFTGDTSGSTLYGALHRAGYANRPVALHRDDGLELQGCYITAIARCAPPGNRPTRQEIGNCHGFLIRELGLLTEVRVVMALGRMAFEQIVTSLKELGYEPPAMTFAHGQHSEIRPGGHGNIRYVITSYHPSRQNTQTGRLTPAMLDEVFQLARRLQEQ
jgi:uracil-DNA glycosylase family 4